MKLYLDNGVINLDKFLTVDELEKLYKEACRNLNLKENYNDDKYFHNVQK